MSKCEPSYNMADIMSYTSQDNFYTCKSDGYVFVNSWGNYGCIMHTVNGFHTSFYKGESRSLFVKRGCRIYFEYESINSLQIFFAPLA